MLKWDSISKWGRRGSDTGTPVPAVPVRDLVLEGVIAHEQVELLFQPQIDVRSGRAIGAEALARSPVAASADALFARAGAAALGERLSRLIQRKALRYAAAWEGALKDLKLSINLLPADICRSGFEQWLLDEISVSGIDPNRVTVEITETALLEDQDLVAWRLSRLREAGVSIAVDDFGTGYASLAYLTSLPLDMLKIDKGLVAGIVGGRRDRIVVEAMIRMARELDLKVVAEGIETAEQLALVADWRCDLYQGFFGAGPLSHEELVGFVTAADAVAA
jgi:EAL domain-containing protein (putative c-di-GMP-specific phosphodiesterase class I)